MVDKLRKLLLAIETAEFIDQLGWCPGWRLHALEGGLKGVRSLTLSGSRRLIFLYDDGRIPPPILTYWRTVRKSAMPMKNPPHPGDPIKTEIIEDLDLSVSKAADILKVRRATLTDLLRGKRR